jgi:hypothetical protein
LRVSPSEPLLSLLLLALAYAVPAALPRCPVLDLSPTEMGQFQSYGMTDREANRPAFGKAAIAFAALIASIRALMSSAMP